MKKFILVLILVSFILGLYAQEKAVNLTRKEKKEIRKQEQKKIDKAMSEAVAISLNKQQWVLEATQLSNRKGYSKFVDNTLNFIAIDGNKAFIQLGSNSRLGPNGVGGISVEAQVSKYELIKNDKSGTYFLHIYLASNLGSFDIQLNSNPNGRIASATIRGNTARKLKYKGQLVPLSASMVFKGTPFF
ncbi:DUF4251 domain-containing protein [Ancylomarina sp. YFZ004]